ncbi:MAG: hydantoinase/oxoprolinase family protein, partial [Heyndrickxia sp.]
FNMSAEEGALGIIRIANSNMLNALKLISVRKGYNPREFTLVAFGGGGSMHAAALAKELGVKKVVVPVASPVFSAWGMLMTDLRHDYIQTQIKRLSEVDVGVLNQNWINLECKAYAQFEQEDVQKESVLFTRFLDMRYLGQEHTVKVPVPNGDWNEETLLEIIERFHQLHEKNYSFKLENAQTEIVNMHLTAFGQVQKPSLEKKFITSNLREALKEVRPVYFEGKGWIDTNIYDRDSIPTMQRIEGPAIVEEKASVTVIYDGQSLQVDEYGNLIIDTGVE